MALKCKHVKKSLISKNSGQIKSVVETTEENRDSESYSISDKLIYLSKLFRSNTANGSVNTGEGSTMQEMHRRYPSTSNTPYGKAHKIYPVPHHGFWHSLTLLQRILISNLLIITGGAIAGSWLTAQIAEAGSFNGVTFAIIITCAALFSGSISFLILKIAFRPFEELQQALDKIHSGSPRARAALQRVTDPDVRQFTDALNQMLIRLEENAKVIQEDQRQLQVMTGRVLNAQENERKRIARELHDEASQSLTAMIMGLDAAQRQANDTCLQTKLGTLRDMAASTLEELRKLALDLRPTMLDDLGLIPAVRWLSRGAAERAGLEAKVELDNCSDNERFAPEIETCLFRITQESLTNIVKHAKATKVNIKVGKKPNGEVWMVVSDNGKGFDRSCARQAALNDGHLGLFDIEERATLIGGKAEISTSPSGTTITVILPEKPSTCRLHEMSFMQTIEAAGFQCPAK